MEWIKIFPGVEKAREHFQTKSTQLVVINGMRICLLLYQDQFYAVQDACTHNAESLSKGQLNSFGEIVCPWHNYQFDVHSGKECRSRSSDLKTYEIRYDETGFFIGIG